MRYLYDAEGEGMRRRAFNFAAAISLALCLTTTALWTRSGWRYDQINWFGNSWDVSVSSGGGIVALMAGPVYHGPGAVTIGAGWRYMSYPPPAGGGLLTQARAARYARLGWFGFAYDPNRLITVRRAPPYYFSHRIYLPHWLVVTITAIPPVVWWRHWRRRRRNAAGHCTSCGYNLTANTSGVCPECGTPTTAGVAA
jgi:hypothetical protein